MINVNPMSCPRIPHSKAEKAIERTKETEREHGFVVCGDGSVGELQSGGETGMNVENPCDPGDDSLVVFHTHPNGVKRLSKQDKKFASRDDVNAVCVGVPDGSYMCRTDRKCEGSVSKGNND